MDPAFTSQIIACDFAYQIWNKTEVYFAFQTKAKVKQLKTQFKSIKKEGQTVLEYLLMIMKIVDLLAAMEHRFPLRITLKSFWIASMKTTMHSVFRSKPFSISELEALLMA